MEYNWRKTRIERLKRLAERFQDKRTLENAEIMLDILNSNQDTSIFHIVPENKEFDFDEAFEYYTHNMKHLPDNVLDTLMELFRIEPDFEWFFKRPIITPLDITHKELIELGHDCVKELHDDKLTRTYDEIVKKRNHQLHITDSYNPRGCNAQLDGATLYDTINNRQYIYLYETHTAFDFETLIHETLHARMHEINVANYENISYFRELEGRFGNLLSSVYLDKIGFGDLASELTEYELRTALNDSYNLYVSDLLFGTAQNKQFDLDEVKRCYEEETVGKWDYKPDQLSNIFSIYGFDVATDLLCYLMTMDTYLKRKDIEETYHKMLEMKPKEDIDTITFLENSGYTFMDDGFKDVNKLRLQIKKEGH